LMKGNGPRLGFAIEEIARSAEGASSVINQAAPTFCIQVPMFDTTHAIRSQGNQV
jgi:hypothetical protein